MLHDVQKFFVSLALDPTQMAEYLKNSDKVLDISTVSDEEKALLLSRNQKQIWEYITDKPLAFAVVALEPDAEPEEPTPDEEPTPEPAPEPEAAQN